MPSNETDPNPNTYPYTLNGMQHYRYAIFQFLGIE